MSTKPHSIDCAERGGPMPTCHSCPVPVKVGDWLPNGAIVLQVKPSEIHGDKSVTILALSREEFVTWISSPDGRNCFWGHYHEQDLESALRDFKERS